MDEKKRDKKNKEAIVKLFSSDDSEVMKGLKSVKQNGDASTIRPLLDLLGSSSNQAILSEVIGILNSLKLEEVTDEMVACLKEEKYHAHQATILAGMWNSGMFPNEHIDTISELAVKGDFMTAVEAMTVIENMEAPFEMEALQEASMIVADYLMEDPEEDKTELIRSMQQVLQNFEQTVDFG